MDLRGRGVPEEEVSGAYRVGVFRACTVTVVRSYQVSSEVDGIWQAENRPLILPDQRCYDQGQLPCATNRADSQST